MYILNILKIKYVVLKGIFGHGLLSGWVWQINLLPWQIQILSFGEISSIVQQKVVVSKVNLVRLDELILPGFGQLLS